MSTSFFVKNGSDLLQPVPISGLHPVCFQCLQGLGPSESRKPRKGDPNGGILPQNRKAPNDINNATNLN
eukprot:1899298-Amphidinium_carterae.1